MNFTKKFFFLSLMLSSFLVTASFFEDKNISEIIITVPDGSIKLRKKQSDMKRRLRIPGAVYDTGKNLKEVACELGYEMGMRLQQKYVLTEINPMEMDRDGVVVVDAEECKANWRRHLSLACYGCFLEYCRINKKED